MDVVVGQPPTQFKLDWDVALNAYKICVETHLQISIWDKQDHLLCEKIIEYDCFPHPEPGKVGAGHVTPEPNFLIKGDFEIVAGELGSWRIVRSDADHDGFESVVLFDVTGRVIPASISVSRAEIGVRIEIPLATGVYFLVVKTTDGVALVQSVFW